MPKTTKSKDKPKDHELEALNHLTETMKIVNSMQQNMEVLNNNMQGAIDQIEEIQSIVNRMRDRMGL
tara:strand:+ start:383 stop:583 length:201 start_codon:yes stop_codon:yes gene_type:complete